MSVTAAPLTVEAFLELPEPEGQKIELIEGEVVAMGRGGYRHEKVKTNAYGTLKLWLARNPIGEVFAQTMFVLNPEASPIPDVSFVRNERLTPELEGHIQGAPDLAIEIVSSETAAELERKVSLYLAHGSKAVWTVFPKQRAIRVYTPGGASRKLEAHETLDAPELLPGFSGPVAALLQGV